MVRRSSASSEDDAVSTAAEQAHFQEYLTAHATEGFIQSLAEPAGDPGMSQDLSAHDPGNHDPGNHDPGDHDPGNHDPGDHDPGAAAHDAGAHDAAGAAAHY
jgi:hypothetical protein